MKQIPAILLSRLIRRRMILSAQLSLLFLLAAGGLQAPAARPLKDRSLPGQTMPGRNQAACPSAPPDGYSIEKPAAQLRAENDEGDDDEETEEPPAGDTGSSGSPGLYDPAFGCLLIDGAMYTGVQTSMGSAGQSRLAPATRVTDSQSLLLGVATFTHHAQTEAGELTTRFGIEASQDSAAIQFASIMYGNAIVGVQPSFFNGWLGWEFSFRALAAVQSPLVAAYVFRPTDNSTLSVALEDPTYRRITLSGYGPLGFPDAVARYRYSSGNWQFILSAASHQTTFSNSILNPLVASAPIWGAAVQAYARYALPNDAQSDRSFVLLQLAYAKQAAGYLGINTTAGAFKIQLPGALGADSAERSTGWNGAAVVGWAWSEQWRSAAFTSFTKLALGDLVGTGSILSSRSAVNLTYTPVTSLDISIEAGFARVLSANSAIPSAKQWSLIFSAVRYFP